MAIPCPRYAGSVIKPIDMRKGTGEFSIFAQNREEEKCPTASPLAALIAKIPKGVRWSWHQIFDFTERSR